MAGLAAVLTNSAGSSSLVKTNAATFSSGVGADPVAQSFFIQQNTTALSTKPKAFLNVLFFDERMKLDNTASYWQQIGSTSANNPGQEIVLNKKANKNACPNEFPSGWASFGRAFRQGYCYIYISNESNDLVYFDNLTLTHERSPILEETHYYPFGLTMAGISSKAAGGLENRKKYNGIEFDEDLDIDSYEAFYRNLDPQIGRWWEIDPKCDLGADDNESGLESLTPYNSMGNNPVMLSDPLGDEPCCVEAMQIIQQSDILATQIIQFGGGPADVVTDAAATVVVVGGSLLAGLSAFWELSKEIPIPPRHRPNRLLLLQPPHHRNQLFQSSQLKPLHHLRP